MVEYHFKYMDFNSYILNGRYATCSRNKDGGRA